MNTGWRTISPSGRADWVGFTDIYWLSALVPDARGKPDSDFRSLGNGLYRIRRRDYQRMMPPYMEYWQKAA